MTKLSKCTSCKTYNLTDKCRECGKETKTAHYKYSGLRPVEKGFRTKRFRYNARRSQQIS